MATILGRATELRRASEGSYFDGIKMDSQGGGQLIWPKLNKTMQRISGVVCCC
jgi:hypothetical protein